MAYKNGERRMDREGRHCLVWDKILVDDCPLLELALRCDANLSLIGPGAKSLHNGEVDGEIYVALVSQDRTGEFRNTAEAIATLVGIVGSREERPTAWLRNFLRPHTWNPVTFEATIGVRDPKIILNIYEWCHPGEPTLVYTRRYYNIWLYRLLQEDLRDRFFERCGNEYHTWALVCSDLMDVGVARASDLRCLVQDGENWDGKETTLALDGANGTSWRWRFKSAMRRVVWELGDEEPGDEEPEDNEAEDDEAGDDIPIYYDPGDENVGDEPGDEDDGGEPGDDDPMYDDLWGY
jgi:hypothetical protein